jgi:hypothetical protein
VKWVTGHWIKGRPPASVNGSLNIVDLSRRAGEWLCLAGRVRPAAARLATRARPVRDRHPPGADTRRRAALPRPHGARRSARAPRRWRAPGVGATGRQWGDRGRRSGGAPRARRRQESPFLRVFGTLRRRADAGNGASVGGVGKVIRARAMGESGRARRFWPVKSPQSAAPVGG